MPQNGAGARPASSRTRTPRKAMSEKYGRRFVRKNTFRFKTTFGMFVVTPRLDDYEKELNMQLK